MDTILHKGENSKFISCSSVGCAFSGNVMPGNTQQSNRGQERLRRQQALRAGEGVKVERGQTMRFINPVYIVGQSTYVGSKEGKGPIGKFFHKVAQDDKLGEKSFECAEIKMLEESVSSAIKNSGKKLKDIDLLLSGDLLNQITSSAFVARDLGIPFVGVYSACSTMTSALALAASLINAGYYDNIACATASHFATAERQYRYPLEYGCQRPPYAQWTVTGAACSVLSSESSSGDNNGGNSSGLSGKDGAHKNSKDAVNNINGKSYGSKDLVNPRITMATFGKVIDFGTNDLNNMGAAMAPDCYII